MKRMLIAALVVLAGGPTSAAESLSIYNWGEYIDLTIIEEFERETGVKVVYDTYESGETTEAMLMAGGSGYDLVVTYRSSVEGAAAVQRLVADLGRSCELVQADLTDALILIEQLEIAHFDCDTRLPEELLEYQRERYGCEGTP